MDRLARHLHEDFQQVEARGWLALLGSATFQSLKSTPAVELQASLIRPSLVSACRPRTFSPAGMLVTSSARHAPPKVIQPVRLKSPFSETPWNKRTPMAALEVKQMQAQNGAH